MGPSIRLGLCVLLGGLLLACSPSYPAVQASSETSPRVNQAPSGTQPTPWRPEWRIGTPATHGNLTVFPVLSAEPTRAGGFITLDEGLQSGKVIITELGEDGRSRRVTRGRRVSDDAEVNRLALTNKSGKTLILIAGEVVIGGKQDRIVGHDCLVASGNAPVEIDVFCVEQGRWEERPLMGQSRGVGRTGGVGSDGGSGSGTGSGVAAGGGGGSFAMAAPMIAAPDVREKAQAKKDQSAVWSAVTETVTVTASASPTRTLNRVYENKRVKDKLRGYERALRAKLMARNVIGAVVAVGGEVITTDVFASPAIFQAYWPKLLKSYALQAISTTDSQHREVPTSEAERFLLRAGGTKSSDGRKGVYKLTEHQSSTDASFELEHDANRATLIHFNRVMKK